MLWTDDRDWVVVQGTLKLRGQRRFLGLGNSRSILNRQEQLRWILGCLGKVGKLLPFESAATAAKKTPNCKIT